MEGQIGGKIKKFSGEEDEQQKVQREREEKKKKNVFWFWQRWVRILCKISATLISPRVAHRAVIFLKPLGRIYDFVRADLNRFEHLRPTLTVEWEAFRTPNQVILESISHGIKFLTTKVWSRSLYLYRINRRGQTGNFCS